MRILRHLAGAAELELEERTRDYPGFIARGIVARDDAEADCQAWREIARWCAEGRPVARVELSAASVRRWDPERAADAPEPSRWEILFLAAAKAARHLERLRDATPDDEALSARLGRVLVIRDGLANARDFYAAINARPPVEAAA